MDKILNIGHELNPAIRSGAREAHERTHTNWQAAFHKPPSRDQYALKMCKYVKILS
jgi:hypothetical protein